MSDTETEHNKKSRINPYYQDIYQHILSKEELFEQPTDLVDECRQLLLLSTRLRARASTVFLAKQIYLRAGIYNREALLTSFWIALKYDEVQQLSLKQFESISNCDRIAQVEQEILEKIEFNLAQPTVMTFIEILVCLLKHEVKISSEQISLINCLALMTLPWCMNYQPSTIATSIIVLSFRLMGKQRIELCDTKFQLLGDFSNCYQQLKLSLYERYDENVAIRQKFPLSFQAIRRSVCKLM